MDIQNLIVITGNQFRHRYFQNHLNAHFPVSAVFVEEYDYPSPVAATDAENQAWESFFRRREEYEQHLLFSCGNLSAKNIPEVLHVGQGRLNHPGTLEAVRNFHPSQIIVFGASLLGPGYLSPYTNHVLNLHLGLSQYHRGASCNFWPVHEGRPGLLGATIHKVTSGIDTGEIIRQETIQLDENDDEQTLAGKTLILGTRLVTETLNNPTVRKIVGNRSKANGKLYQMKDFTPRATLEVRKLIGRGILKQQIVTENQTRKTDS
jgi:folate-dependent phosphoribosylglycinamide formyltransferase PurN